MACVAPGPLREFLGPFRAEVTREVSPRVFPKRGCCECLEGCLRAPSGPGLGSVQKCPESVRGVPKRCPGHSEPHFLDIPNGAGRAPQTPLRTLLRTLPFSGTLSRTFPGTLRPRRARETPVGGRALRKSWPVGANTWICFPQLSGHMCKAQGNHTQQFFSGPFNVPCKWGNSFVTNNAQMQCFWQFAHQIKRDAQPSFCNTGGHTPKTMVRCSVFFSHSRPFILRAFWQDPFTERPMSPATVFRGACCRRGSRAISASTKKLQSQFAIPNRGHSKRGRTQKHANERKCTQKKQTKVRKKKQKKKNLKRAQKNISA